MNKRRLEIAKAIAEIEGIKVNKEVSTNCETGEAVEWLSYLPRNNAFTDIEEMYNPFNWSILGPLMIKYKIEVQYAEQAVVILDEYGEALFWSWFKDESKIPKAILECIIESKRLS